MTMSIMIALIESFCTLTIFHQNKTLEDAIILLLIFVCYFFHNKNNTYKSSKKIIDYISPLLFGIFMIVGESFEACNSFSLIFASKKTIIFYGIKFLGWFFTFNAIIDLLRVYLKKIYYYKLNIKNNTVIKINDFVMVKHSFIMPFIIICLCWLPYLIIKYPANVCDDSKSQIAMLFGMQPFTAHHPPFHTYLCGLIIKFFDLIGMINLGFFLSVLMQFLTICAVFAFCIYKMNTLKIKSRYSWVVLLIISLVPMFPLYATVILKDIYYIAFFILYVIFMYELIMSNKIYKKTIFKVIIFASLMSLTRNNGVYILYLTLPFLILVKVKKGLLEVLLSLSALVIPIIVVLFANNFLYPNVLGIEKGNSKEALSIPFQQTARLVRDYPQDISEEDKSAIDKVLQYDTLAERYDPLSSDPVKNVIKHDVSSDLPDYFKAWFHGLLKHPITYIEATINTSYMAFYPNSDNRVVFIENDLNNKRFPELIPTQLASFSFGRSLAGFLDEFIGNIPLLKLIDNPVISVWIVIVLFFEFIKRNDFERLTTLIPFICTIFIIVAGPCVKYHPRYIFPIMWTMYIYIALLISKKSNAV